MPKATFLNLPESKRHQFLESAIMEFSLKGFEGASLTKLVKTLNIAKGSLYQYFEDKEDIYRFLIIEACHRRLPFYSVLEGKPRGDLLFSYLIISLKFDITYPHLGSLFYGAIATKDPQLIQIIDQEFCQKIPQSPLLKGIPMIFASFANFTEAIAQKNLDLAQIINNRAEIPVSTDEIIRIIQNNTIR